MNNSKQQKQQHQLQQRGCKALCYSCRFSVSSSEEAESSSASDRFPSVSSLAHAMVQERLDQMIRARHVERRRQQSRKGTKFVVMVAMEKSSYDPREDFRESMMEMITANRLQDAKDLRSLLNYYISMNSDEYHSLILEVFYERNGQLDLTVSEPKKKLAHDSFSLLITQEDPSHCFFLLPKDPLPIRT